MLPKKTRFGYSKQRKRLKADGSNVCKIKKNILMRCNLRKWYQYGLVNFTCKHSVHRIVDSWLYGLRSKLFVDIPILCLVPRFRSLGV